MIEVLKSLLKQSTTHIMLLFCLIFSGQILAQSSLTHIPADSLNSKSKTFSLQKSHWKFHAGDTSQWASKNFDDADWAAISSHFG